MDKALLCVDDETHILAALKRLLRQEDYRIFTAESGEEGLATLEKHPIQVVLSDQRMPQMTGIEFLQKVKELYPDTIRVVLSGYADAHVIVEAINQGEVFRFIGKPWNDDELKAVIRQCFEHYDILKQNRELIQQTRVQNEELRKLNDTLEEMVEERTRSLQHSQEILEHLPVGVIGISREGMIIITNRAAQKIVSSLGLVLPGSDMDGNIPHEIKAEVISRMKDGSSGEIYHDNWDGKSMKVYIQPLGQPGAIRGCLLMLDVKHSHL